ncbi:MULTISPECIES: hypothetical protein [Sphingobacterium]|uniref:hypothetical protein n=1 Tax=Sphingobacterium TaxID=28453 RepID=UPI00257AD36E|nr:MULTISPECIES: hypothetical protein [Sphingobacterium]
MRTDNKHIDQSSELSALRDEISDLKNMMSVMQVIITTQNKQIAEIHKSLFNNPIKSKDTVREERIQARMGKIIMKNLKK